MSAVATDQSIGFVRPGRAAVSAATLIAGRSCQAHPVWATRERAPYINTFNPDADYVKNADVIAARFRISDGKSITLHRAPHMLCGSALHWAFALFALIATQQTGAADVSLIRAASTRGSSTSTHTLPRAYGRGALDSLRPKKAKTSTTATK
jgi:hypothetical protein